MSCFKTVFYGFPDDGMEILKFLKIMVSNKKQRQIEKKIFNPTVGKNITVALSTLWVLQV